MRPTLFSLGGGAHPFQIHSYGMLIAIGLLVGVAVAVRRGRSVGIETGITLDLTFYAIVVGLLGSRLLYVLFHAGQYVRLCAGSGAPRSFGQMLNQCTAALQFWQGGLVFLGGAILAAASTLILAHRKGLGLGLVADVLAPSVSLAHVFGRMGCFLVGCCYGKPWSAGVHFPAGSVAYTELEQTGSIPPGALETSGLHPTQLYESLGELAIFLLLCLIWRRRKFPGAVALVYAFSYGILRLVVEIFRGDEGPELLATVRIPLLAKAFGLSPTVPLFLSSAQAMALGLSVVAAVVYVVLIRRAASPGDTIRISRNDVSS